VTVRRLLGAGLAAFALTLLLTIPAERLRAPLQQHLPVLAPGAMTGHVLAGQAVPLAIGELVVDRVTWRWRPGRLLFARLAFDIELRSGPSSVTLRIERPAWSGTLALTALRGSIDLEHLGRSLPALPGRARGRLDLEGLALALDADGRVAAASGDLRLADAELTTPVALLLGDLDGHLRSAGAWLELAFSFADGGPLAGTGVVGLAADGGYRVSARVVPGSTADPDQVALLRMAGRQAGDGTIRIEQSGRLPTAAGG
jgi:hypothetical protein